MRVVSWNLHGAAIPGRATHEQQERAWQHIRTLGADLILAQEATTGAIPDWVREEWTLITGEHGRFRKTWNWGSVVAAKPDLGLVLDEEALHDPWLPQLYDLVLVTRLTAGALPLVVASVHTAAMAVREFTRNYATTLTLEMTDFESLKRPNCREAPYLNDLAFAALARVIGSRRFLAAGDWNTCRKYRGGLQFFERAAERGWRECHQGPEQSSYFTRAGTSFQLDHAFCDRATFEGVSNCRIDASESLLALSDHAPLMLEVLVDRVSR